MFKCGLLVITVIISVNCVHSALELVILHTNDMHGRFDETSKNSGTCKEKNRGKNCIGGFARLAHEIRRIKSDVTGKEVLFLNAGDTYTGTTWFAMYRENITVEFMNALKPDVMVSNKSTYIWLWIMIVHTFNYLESFV